MDANILKEFLVKVGFAVDRGGMRALVGGLGGVTKAAEGVAKAAVGMAAAVTAAVTVTARQLDELYYAAQRADSSAAGLMAVGQAARAVGLSASGVRGQIESMAASFRDLPSMRAWLQSVTGARGTPEQMFSGLASWYARMRSENRELYARLVLRAAGLDPESIRQVAMNLPAFLRSRDEMTAWFRALGFEAGAATSASKDFMREINRSWGLFSTVWDKIAVTLLPVLQAGIRSLNDLVVAHLGDIRAFVDGPLKDAVAYLADPETWARIRRAVEDAFVGIKRLVGEGVDWIRMHFEEVRKAAEENWPAVRDRIREVGDAVGWLVDKLKWIEGHPKVAGALLGAVAGARFGGLPGAVVGAGAGAALTPESDAEREARLKAWDANTSSFNPANTFSMLYRWLTEQTHSPNVEIYEARGIWAPFRQWLQGSRVAAPIVALADDTLDRLREALGFAPAGARGTRNAPAGAPRDAAGRVPSAPWSAPGDAATSGRPGDPRGVEAALRASALRYGVNPDDVVAIARREGMGARKYATWDVNGLSYGALQMHQRGAGRGYTTHGGGMANAFWEATGLDPSDPKNEIAMNDWAVWWASRNGWRPWTSVSSGRAIVPRRIGPPAAGPWRAPAVASASFSGRAPYGTSSSYTEGDRHITVAPQTTIHVHGDDARQTARYVGDRQTQVTANAVRAFQPVAT